MPKIILTSRYIRDAPPAQLENYVRYVSTREGVEKIDESRLHLPATQNQKRLIRQLLRDLPHTKEMLEYEDYCLHPTIGNASEFISCALEQNLELVGKKENYVDYIANRPRVERIGEHGLFTDAGKPVVISNVQEEVVNHKGPVWTHVISLRREDAARLGYDSGKQWRELLRSKRAMLCKHMKIDSANLRWYAAFHNESHHPHIHLMVYSAKDNDGFLTEKSIEAMRSELAHDIFRQDFAHIYEGQNQARSAIKEEAARAMKERIRQMEDHVCGNPAIGEQLVVLSGRLQNTGGKKVYGYLKRDVKAMVDRIVDELAKEPPVAELYRAWGDWQNEILKTYQDQPSPLPPLSSQPQFKSIKNMVIAEAMKLGGHHVTFEDEAASDQSDMSGPPDPSGPSDQEVEMDPLPEAAEPQEEPEDISLRAEWSARYKTARQYLYGGKAARQDFEEALRLFLLEAESGNALAMYDLGRMYADGLGCGIDMETAGEWYKKALDAFHSAEQSAEERQRPYLQYRIGKMYAADLGTEQDYGLAAEWFSKAVSANHKYAQYSLAGLYCRGQGVSQDHRKAFHLYRCSASQENPYASYELAKMYRDGIGTEKNSGQADQQFQNAFNGFLELEAQSHDDKLQYRIGQMYYTGVGTEKDGEAAAAYWERSARLGNVNAQYALGKLWLEKGGGDPEKAVAWITKAAEGGNGAAQYALAKIYRDGEHVPRDMEKAVELFTLSAEQKNDYAAYALGRLYLSGEDIPKDTGKAVKYLSFSAGLGNPFAEYQLGKFYLEREEAPKDVAAALRWFEAAAAQGNQYAQYQLGKLYLAGEDVPKNVETAIHWLEASAGQQNQFAQYALGKLYLCGHDVPRDKDKAVSFLEASAAQGNIYAEFLLDHLDSFHDPSILLAATRLMHRLGSLFQEEYHKEAGGSRFSIDRKRRRRLQEKKQAQGHARGDQEQQIHS